MSKRKADSELIERDKFLQKYYGFNSQVETKLGAKRNNTMDLHESAARLCDVKALLVDAVSTLSDPNRSKTKINAAVSVIKKTILPYLDVAAKNSRDIANVVSPIAGAGYVHDREMAETRRELVHTSPLTRVNEYISSKISPTSTKPPSKKNQPHRNAKAKKIPTNIVVPDPKNGTEYGVGEFIQYAIKYRKGTCLRSKFLEQVLIKKYVKKDLYTLYCKLRAYEGEVRIFVFGSKWNDVGKPALLSKAEVKEAAQRIMSSGGEKEML